MPRRENKATPKVISGVLYHETGSFSVESPEWWAWLERGETFYVALATGTFTARCEERGTVTRGDYWYAFRRHRGKLYKVYVGQSKDLTNARLAAAAQQLADKAGADMS